MRMNFHYDTFATPVGDVSIALDENGKVSTTVFGDISALKKRRPRTAFVRDAKRLKIPREQVLGYFTGKRRDFELPLGARGTPFQISVWQALQSIPFGETRTYGEIARQVGKTYAARAIGRASGANPLCLLVPCHRVIGADGSLTGFAFGKEVKRRLLEHEREQGQR